MTAVALTSSAAAARVALQRLALAALDEALVPGSGGDGVPEALLWPFLADDEALGFAVRRAPGRARARFVMSDPGEWSLYQRRRLPVDRIVPAMLRRWGRLSDRVRRRPDIGLPEARPLLDAVAASAWAEIGFRTDAAARIRRQLRVEVLMSPAPPAFPALSPPFWWCLIAARAGSGPLAGRLRAKADSAAEGPEWAGFWEQYLILRAQRDAVEFGKTLGRLPLVAKGAEALRDPDPGPNLDPGSQAASAAVPPAVRPDWRAEAPGWAEALIDRTI